MKELVRIISKKLCLYSLVFNTIYSVADYGISFIIAYFTTSPLTLDKLTKLAIGIAIAQLIMLITGKVASYIDNVNDAKMQTTIQKYYFDKVYYMTMEQISNIHTGYIHKLITTVGKNFTEMFWQFEIGFIPLIIGGTSILIMVCKESLVMGIICIIISILAVYSKYKMIKNKHIYQKEVNDTESKYNATFVDFIQNIMAVRKLNILNFCNDKIDKGAENYLKATKINERKRSNANGVFTSFMDLLYIVVIISTIVMVKNGKDALPFLLFYITALGKLYANLNSLARLIYINEKFKTSKKQLDEYFANSKKAKIIDKFNKLEAKEIVFSYNEESAKIKIPEFRLNKGDKISIMGESGQGKSTIMNVLAGLYPLKNGTILIDGELKENTRLDLVFVSQEVELFNLSIRDNLCLGKNISDEKIIELLEEAGLMEWYKELANGLDSMIGERGIKLSAGQRQRLNLIRGILIDKELYFFDEPTSNLDYISEEKITKMIDKYLKDKTYIIVTHRPKLKELCNKHYLFEEHMMKEIVNI